MATVVWDQSNLEVTRDYYIREIVDFNNKMLQAGLIDYNQNTIAITALQNNTTIFNQSRASTDKLNLGIDLVKLHYKLPIGDGSVKFADVVDSDYKTIVSESYDSTECYLRFTIKMIFNKSQNTSTTAIKITPTSIPACATIACDYNISLTDYFDINNEQRSYIGNINYDITKSSYATKKSIIHLGANNLFISWMFLRHESTGTSNTNITTVPRLVFNLYRKNNNINVFTPDPQSIESGSTSPNGYGYNPKVYTVFKYGTYSATTPSEILQGVNANAILINEDRMEIRYTYMNSKLSVEYNPSVYRLLYKIDVDYLFSLMNIISFYKGEKVKMSFLQYGRFTDHFRWAISTKGVTEYNPEGNTTSYLFLMNDHPCTTQSVV